MTGPEHYREAERLLAQEYETWEERSAISAAAQVHATLALAAATALHSVYISADTSSSWSTAIGADQ